MIRGTFGNFNSIVIDCYDHNTEIINNIKSDGPIKEIVIEENSVYKKEEMKEEIKQLEKTTELKYIKKETRVKQTK